MSLPLIETEPKERIGVMSFIEGSYTGLLLDSTINVRAGTIVQHVEALRDLDRLIIKDPRVRPEHKPLRVVFVGEKHKGKRLIGFPVSLPDYRFASFVDVRDIRKERSIIHVAVVSSCEETLFSQPTYGLHPFIAFDVSAFAQQMHGRFSQEAILKQLPNRLAVFMKLMESNTDDVLHKVFPKHLKYSPTELFEDLMHLSLNTWNTPGTKQADARTQRIAQMGYDINAQPDMNAIHIIGKRLQDLL